MSTAAVVAIPAVLMGAAVIWICVYFWREGSDLRTAGVEAIARLARKYRGPGDSYMLGLENCFVTAHFYDASGVLRTAEIRVPSRQWHLLREGSTRTILYLPANPMRARVVSRGENSVVAMLMIFGMCCGGFMAVLGLFVLSSGARFTPPQPAAVAPPPPSKFDKSGVDRVAMSVSPQHDRVAVLDEAGRELRIREIASGRLIASRRGNGWRLLDWRPDAARLAVAHGSSAISLDSATLQPASGESYSWSRPAPGLDSCSATPVWDASGTRAAAPCGNRVMMLLSTDARMLVGPTDRVLNIAWSPSGHFLAAVSEDNYARVWNTETQQCVGRQ
jgi:Protein of unknown function (DUF3592)/WD domain, G-beta repeat